MIYKSLFDNKLDSFDSALTALNDSMTPYLELLNNRIDNRDKGTSFNKKAMDMEFVSRFLWGFISWLGGSSEYKQFQPVIDKLWSGLDPDSNNFWGNPRDFDQIIVEMPTVALALFLKPKVFWDPVNPEKKKTIVKWLSQVNSVKVPQCNWLFFPLLVNGVLLKLAPEYANTSVMDECINKIESFYAGNGWFNDGDKSERRNRDYYTPWGFYLLGLVFITICPDFSPDFTSTFKEKTTLFARQYRTWFSPEGSGIAYGRSLTYHCAQSAFWGALVFANLEALPWDEVRGLWARNMRWWFKQSIYSETGIQQIGYAYPNLYMSERYNSPSSLLWSFQAFLPLAIGKDHPFWQAKEAPLVQNNNIFVQKETGFLIHNIHGNNHSYVIANGQFTPGISNEHNHMSEKYEKFAYSYNFGFNIAVDLFGIDKLAPDNMLLVSKEDEFYRFKKESYNHFISEQYGSSSWKPFTDVEITTYQIPVDDWIVRVHHIKNETSLRTVEGGFPLPYDDRDFYKEMNHSYIQTEAGISCIHNIRPERNSRGVNSAPNSNLMSPNTYIPILECDLTPGEHILISCVIAKTVKVSEKEIMSSIPDVYNCCQCLPPEVLALVNKR
ncbi:DUF2264 domain-containing protein [Spirochaeta cellobiosiphila]|uniref:DUF2264 domain-containing protein n=1 Tax=Spirochaeta cellobiosiphila TaxID=504483 RepID=UPI00040A7C53|nr:DUF2264 domain-containing protein [Spirochaeta cellobiosiphila]